MTPPAFLCLDGPQSVKAALATATRQVRTGMLNAAEYGTEG